jgi:RimJ/RimL family protein N-acetyltransferase
MRIRPYEDSDADELCAAVHESLGDLWPWMPFADASYSRASASAWILTTQMCWAKHTMYDFAVFDQGGAYCGGCGINQINTLHQMANLGYWVRSSAAGKGIAAGAVNAVATWAFGNTTLNRLEIVVATNNVRSHRVAEKVGAVREGVLRKRVIVDGNPSDATLYSLIRPD